MSDFTASNGLRAAAAFAMGCCATMARGQGTPADKSGYTLLNPTPHAAMREMETDRPDTTESPFTVDSGHVQVELSFIEYGRDDGGTEEWDVLPANLKVGVLNNVEVQFLVAPYIDIDSDNGPHTAGIGDTQLRVKISLWGNDGGPAALAVMPYLQFPTGESDLTAGHAEGGVIVPGQLKLNDQTDLGFMVEADFLRDEENDGWDTSILHTITVGRDLTDQLGVFIEYAGVLPLGGGEADYEAHGNAGVTYAVTDDVQIDAGLNVGLTDNAEDLRLFAGVSYRL